MRERADTRFISVGQPFAQWSADEFGARALAIPFTALEVYPAAMTHFDIALAPAGKGDYFKGKSDLRWLEAAALGMPCIADPDVYPEIEHGVTGFHASTPAEMGGILRELVADRDLRERVGAAAREYVTEHRTRAGRRPELGAGPARGGSRTAGGRRVDEPRGRPPAHGPDPGPALAAAAPAAGAGRGRARRQPSARRSRRPAAAGARWPR